MLKKAWKIVLAVVLALLVVVLGYVAYVFIDYHRIGNQELTRAEFQHCLQIIKQSGALQYAQDQAQDSAEKALAVLDNVSENWGNSQVEFLRDLTSYLLTRTH